MSSKGVIAGLILALGPGCAVDTQARARATELPLGAAFDVEHYAIEIDLDPSRGEIEASCTIRLWAPRESVRRVDLHLAGLSVRSITDRAGRGLAYQRSQEALSIDLATPLTSGEFEEITVRYGGAPSAGLWFAGDSNGAPTQVFTHGQCTEGRAWIPCRDVPSERATSEIIVHMPVTWVSMAAGERVERIENVERATERWRMAFPHPSYLETLVAGEFSVEHDEWNDLPLQYVCAPRLTRYLRETFAETGAILEFFTERTGVRFPYAKYAQVCVDNFPFGGMENVSATTLTDTMLPDEQAFLDGNQRELIAHEAAHQWFGNLVTCLTWNEAWLNEGFATYFAALYEEHVEGREVFERTMRGIRAVYLARDTGPNRRAIVAEPSADPLSAFFTGHAYQGGATRLHYLRGLLGDEVFFAGVRHYVARNRGSAVTTVALRESFESVSGRNLERWFAQWLAGAGHPSVTSAWRYEPNQKQVTLVLGQDQRASDHATAVFDIELDVEIAEPGSTRVERVRFDRRRAEFAFACASEPRWVRVDPRDVVPMDLDERMPAQAWLALAREGDVSGRLRAIGVLEKARRGELKGREVERIDEFLLAAAAEDECSDIREAALLALARFVSPAQRSAARDLFLYSARSDVDRNAKIAAFKGLRTLGRDPQVHEFVLAALARVEGWALRGEAVGVMATSQPESAFEFLLGQLDVRSAHGVFEARVLAEIFATKDPRARGVLLQWLRDESRPDAARAVALRELARSRLNEQELMSVIDALASPRIRMRREAVAALASSDDPRARVALEAHAASRPSAIERLAVEAALDEVDDDS